MDTASPKLKRTTKPKTKPKTKRPDMIGNQYAVGNKGGGRPTSFKKEYVEQAYKLCLLGATDKDLANFFNVTEQAINIWKRKYNDFCLVLQEGKMLADANVAKRFYNRARGYEHPEDKIFLYEGSPVIVPTIKHYPPDTQAAIFWLMNRQPRLWKDKKSLELSGVDGGPIETKQEIEFTDDSIQAAFNALYGKKG